MHRHHILALASLLLLPLGALACSDDDETSSSTTASSSAAASTGDAGSSGGEAKPHTDATDEELEIWQSDLNAVGCYAGPVDGKLGPLTEAAIKAYQSAAGLTVDGLLGPQTEAALQADVAAGNTVCVATIEDATAGGGANAELTSTSYGNTFVIGACTNQGETDLVLQAEGPSNLTLVVNAPTGSGTLAVSGGTEADGITLNGQISRVSVGDDGSFTAEGVFGAPNLEGETFTLTGSCATS